MPFHLRSMHARDQNEIHRVATPLELFFDLVAVIAIAAVTASFHHAISHGHGMEMLPNFLFVFAAIWWAWMNYTWFASAFDNGDAVFTSLTMVIMAGFLTVAGSTEHLFETFDFSYAVIGWVMMRLALVVLWLRVALHAPHMRRTAYRYVFGLGFAQVLWLFIAFGVEPMGGVAITLTLIATAFEFAVPLLAEKGGNPVPWHRHHLIERYGLLTIIVLGEVLLSGSLAMTSVVEHGVTPALLELAISTLVIVFGLWWLYFADEEHLPSTDMGVIISFGYGHFLIYAGVALLGAGLAAVLDVVTHHSVITETQVIWYVAVPVAVYLFGLWLVRDRFHELGARGLVTLLAAAAVLVAAALGLPLWALALVIAMGVPARLGFGGQDMKKDIS